MSLRPKTNTPLVHFHGFRDVEEKLTQTFSLVLCVVQMEHGGRRNSCTFSFSVCPRDEEAREKESEGEIKGHHHVWTSACFPEQREQKEGIMKQTGCLISKRSANSAEK